MPDRTIHTIVTLIKKDVLLESRMQHSLYGILLYLASTCFVIYLTNGQPDYLVWNALFWITQLFISVNAVAKSFLQESKGKMLYYYTIVHPTYFIVAKLIFNALLMVIMSLCCGLLFTLLLGNPIVNAIQFCGITVLGGVGISFVFTFLAAIAAKAQQSSSLMAILGFPIIVPQLLLLSKISIAAYSQVVVSDFWQWIAMLMGLDILIIALAWILFPFLWKD
jgi:heme exporter protein B